MVEIWLLTERGIQMKTQCTIIVFVGPQAGISHWPLLFQRWDGL